MSDDSSAQIALDASIDSIRTLLVPLDGSARAEQALPVAELLAQKLGSALLLVQVAPVVSPATGFASQGQLTSPEVHQQLVEDAERLAREYLDAQAARIRSHTQLTVRTLVTRGETSTCLLDVGPAERADLIVMTTHGRTGVARMALGSVADRLVCQGTIPVLLLRSFKGATPPLEVLSRALVPLDGSMRAEAALPFVLRLAGSVVSGVEAIRVIPTSAHAETPGGTIPDRQSTEGEAPLPATPTAGVPTYLQGVAERYAGEFAARGCALVTRIVEKDAADVAGAILAAAQERSAFVAMATHGRRGLARLALGSVAEQVLREGTSPLLLIRSV